MCEGRSRVVGAAFISPKMSPTLASKHDRSDGKPAAAVDVRREIAFTLPCGCTSITKSDKTFEIRWCPFHRGTHGIVPGIDYRVVERVREIRKI
jgi:hypothetical protein